MFVDFKNPLHKRIYLKIYMRYKRKGYENPREVDGFLAEVVQAIEKEEAFLKTQQEIEKPEYLQQEPFTTEQLESDTWWRSIKERQRQREIELSGDEAPRIELGDRKYRTPAPKFPSPNAIEIVNLDEQLSYSETGIPIIKRYRKKEKEETEECWKNLV